MLSEVPVNYLTMVCYISEMLFILYYRQLLMLIAHRMRIHLTMRAHISFPRKNLVGILEQFTLRDGRKRLVPKVKMIIIGAKISIMSFSDNKVQQLIILRW